LEKKRKYRRRILTAFWADLNEAFSIYRSISSICKLNTALFRTMAKACNMHNQYPKTVSLWKDMQRDRVVPDEVCFGTISQACSKIGDSQTAAQLIDYWHQGKLQFTPSVVHCINLVKAVQEVDQLQKLWHLIQKYQVILTPILCTTIFTTCANIGPPGISIGKDVHSHLNTAMVGMDVILLNTIINMYDKCGQPSLALEFFTQHRQQVRPDSITYSTILAACGNVGSGCFKVGEAIFLQSCNENLMDLSVLAAFLRLLVKCGHAEQVNSVWKQFSPHVSQFDHLACHSMLSTCTELRKIGLALGNQVCLNYFIHRVL
jgi:pentatricopeptide repeat protein